MCDDVTAQVYTSLVEKRFFVRLALTEIRRVLSTAETSEGNITPWYVELALAEYRRCV